jgi:ferredoxin-type protein NapF
MPWLDTTAFHERCTRCGDCVRACPDAIVIAGDGGFPRIDFTRGGCSFCGACADACGEALFSDRARAPWHARVVVGPGCLAHAGVVCESCRDGCESRAIRFTPAPGRVPIPALELERCTGCGACVGVCPAHAITWTAEAPGRDARDVA